MVLAHAQPIKLQSYPTDSTLPNKLLIEALNRAELDYVYPHQAQPELANTRIMNDVKNGGLDVMWSMTSAELERDYQALYYPLYRGLMAMRVAIVRRDRADLFADVTSKAQLQHFRAGQGRTWADTEILRHNGIEVATAVKFFNLFYMLEGGRFDFFPRGVHEPWNEIEDFADYQLTVEPDLLLRYTAPLYFFVNKNNQQLASQLNSALESMVQDGTFERMFFADQEVQRALARGNLQNRRVIDLENPYLTEKTPLQRAELWFEPLTYQGPDDVENLNQ